MARSSRPGGVHRIHCGTPRAMSRTAEPVCMLPKAKARYMNGMPRIAITACTLRSCEGASDMRRPVSASVRSIAASGSSSSAPATPIQGALQRKPANQAIIEQLGTSRIQPVGLTSVRSKTRPHSSVARRAGSVTSHSRSQSAAAMARLLRGSITLTKNSSDSWNVNASWTGFDSSPACSSVMAASRWMRSCWPLSDWRQVLAGSRKHCMFSIDWRDTFTSESSIAIPIRAEKTQPMRRLDGVAGRLPGFLGPRRNPATMFARRCRRKRAISHIARAGAACRVGFI